MRAVERIAGLDGLRGVAILLVALYHIWTCISGQKQMPEGSLLSFLYAGNTGVTLFFVLSGFLVSRPFIKRLERGETYSLREYVVQRALRILPPYYTVGLIGVLCMQQFDQLLPMLLLCANGYDLGAFSAVWWSLATEIQFYALVPLLFFMALHPRNAPLLLLVALSAIAVYLAVIFKLIGAPGNAGFELKYQLILSVIGQLPAFMVGLFLSFAHRRWPGLAVGSWVSRICLLGLLALLGWVLLPAARMGPEIYIWNSPWYVLPEALIWGAVVWVMLRREPGVFSMLDNRLTRYFGRVSFSLYLVHMPVIQLVQNVGEFTSIWAALLLAFAVSLVLAQLLYWLVERPSLALKINLSQPQTLQGIQV